MNPDLTTYLDAVIGSTEGHLCVAVGLKPHRDENGKYRHHSWSEVSFTWPRDRHKAAEYVAKSATLGDAYICPYLMREPKRAKGNAAQRVLVHADVDQELDEQAVKELGGFIVRSGSAGHGHVYVPLTWPVTPEQHEALCRGLAAKLGGDHKYADNDLLRPPGTLNRKSEVDGGEPSPVEAVWCSEGRADPRELAAQLGVDLANPINHAQATRQPKHDSPGEPIDLEDYPAVVAALAENTADRSADTYRVVAACRQASLTLEQTRWVIRTREDLRTRLDDRDDDDLQAVWDKLDAKQRTTDRIVPPSAASTLDGAQLLDKVSGTLARYVIFPSDSALIATTLWVAATHALPAWQHATRLAIISPQKRCGKSRLLDIVRLLSFNPMSSTDMSAAVIYRSVGDDDTKTPTLFVDEADALFGTKQKADQNEDLRGLFNAGFQRDRTVWRCVGPNQIPTEFSTFAMAALAAIKGLPDTIVDRSVRIDLQRRKQGETVARFRLRRDTAPLRALRDDLTAWARQPERLKRLADAEPAMPAGVEDRAQDAWEPLVAIADEAGAHWPETARAACEDLGRVEDITDGDIEILTDVKAVLDALPSSTLFVPSKQLVTELRRLDESPWQDESLTAHALSKHLRPFGVRPKHGPGKTARGYWLRDFTDPFARYTRPEVSNRPGHSSDQHEQDDNE